VVVKLNRKSMRVRLVAAVPSQIGGAGYPVGHVIVLPRTLAPTWSPNNCAAPAPEPSK
jgi:hypothetical protein